MYQEWTKVDYSKFLSVSKQLMVIKTRLFVGTISVDLLFPRLYFHVISETNILLTCNA